MLEPQDLGDDILGKVAYRAKNRFLHLHKLTMKRCQCV